MIETPALFSPGADLESVIARLRGFLEKLRVAFLLKILDPPRSPQRFQLGLGKFVRHLPASVAAVYSRRNNFFEKIRG